MKFGSILAPRGTNRYGWFVFAEKRTERDCGRCKVPALGRTTWRKRAPHSTHVLECGPRANQLGQRSPSTFLLQKCSLRKRLSRRAAGPSGSASRGPEDDGRRDQVSRYTSRHDSGEACHLPSHSFGSAPHNMSICAPGCQIQLLWLGGRRTLSPTHQNRSRLSWHESRNACEGMRRRGEHSAHTLHRTRARRPPEANFRARRWLWTASHDDAPSQ